MRLLELSKLAKTSNKEQGWIIKKCSEITLRAEIEI